MGEGAGRQPVISQPSFSNQSSFSDQSSVSHQFRVCQQSDTAPQVAQKVPLPSPWGAEAAACRRWRPRAIKRLECPTLSAKRRDPPPSPKEGPPALQALTLGCCSSSLSAVAAPSAPRKCSTFSANVAGRYSSMRPESTASRRGRGMPGSSFANASTLQRREVGRGEESEEDRPCFHTRRVDAYMRTTVTLYPT